jgi:hypothetical protein
MYKGNNRHLMAAIVAVAANVTLYLRPVTRPICFSISTGDRKTYSPALFSKAKYSRRIGKA